MRKRVSVPMWLVEAVSVGVAAVGVAMWSVPAALVVVGVAGVAACEVRGG
jgi:hypothetical protein